MSSRGRLALALISAFVGTWTTARAEESPLVVTRESALRDGASRGPGVAAAVAPRAAALEARDRATALPHAPVVSLSAGYRAGAITPGAELGVTVLQDLSLRGLGSARASAADALTHAVQADVTRARLDAAARAGIAHIGVLEATELFRLRSDALTQAEGIVKTTRARVQAGISQPIEVAMAEGDLGAAHAGVLDAEGLRVEALAELRFALGIDAAAAVEAIGDLYASDERPLDEASLLRGTEGRVPSLALAKARAALAAEETRLTAATLAPPLGVGASYLREGTGDQIVTGIVSVPLPFVSPGAFETARQRASEDAARAQVDRTRTEVARDVLLALHDRKHWREVRDALRREAVDPMREALRLARVHYEVGTQDISPVLLARQRLVATEEQLAHVAAEVQRADVRLEHAAGTLLARTGGGS